MAFQNSVGLHIEVVVEILAIQSLHIDFKVGNLLVPKTTFTDSTAISSHHFSCHLHNFDYSILEVDIDPVAGTIPYFIKLADQQ
jgi:hypothetical protein